MLRFAPRQVLGPALAAAYGLSLLACAVHFALIDHTIDPHDGHAIGLTDSHRPPPAADRADPAAGPLVAPPAPEHTHSACRFADHLSASSLPSVHPGCNPARLDQDRAAPQAPAPRAAGHRLLLSAPKHSPPA